MHTPDIREVHDIFLRHDRKYCIFSVSGSDNDYLYYSHVARPLRSLMFGKDFSLRMQALVRENEDLCIECGLGLSITGGVALDNGDLVAWNCEVEDANRILAGLKRYLGTQGEWIAVF
ncbi:MAG: hypothetical protein LUQ31_07060 [Methanoregula sp.]|nr:hypothetical protein [Methanoregula sp.]